MRALSNHNLATIFTMVLDIEGLRACLIFTVTISKILLLVVYRLIELDLVAVMQLY